MGPKTYLSVGANVDRPREHLATERESVCACVCLNAIRNTFRDIGRLRSTKRNRRIV
jgi:hypothetical protein